MRRAEWPSPRGPFKINVNGFPIQTHYKREVVKTADGKLDIVATDVAAKDYKDPYWEQCPQASRF
jgi:branched-chain amino acid transport system substrate-binding protein